MKSGKYIITLLLLGVAATVWGQAAEAPAANADQFPKIMAYTLVAAGALLFIVAMIYVIKVNKYLFQRVLHLQAQQSGVTLQEELAKTAQAETFWSSLRKKLWEDPVPMEREGEIMSHHDFDGIHELDNALPPWWVNMFILTIIWAAIYMFYYHFGGGGPSSAEEYKLEVEAAQKLQAGTGGQAAAFDVSKVTALTDKASLEEGHTIFKANCAACHGQLGEGLVGPNFTDQYWIHGGGIKNVFTTITNGVPEKGMISWKAQLTPTDIQKVGSYILSLQGSNPPNPKAPQGDIWKEESTTTPAADTTKVQTTGTGATSK
jgi:cytochrome c oxidase cbb3-type subunit III